MSKLKSKEEQLGQTLLKIYGLTLMTKNQALNELLRYIHTDSIEITLFNSSTPKYIVKPNDYTFFWRNPHMYMFNHWQTLLMGDCTTKSLNEFIKSKSSSWYPYVKIAKRIIDYDSLDELNVKLTLMGCGVYEDS